MTNFYIASKVVHATRWKKLRDDGWPVNSTWIDFGEYGTITDWSDHWDKCISEAASSTFTIAYCEEDEVLKGALCEIGAALAAGRRVLFVGNYEYVKAKRYSIMEHPLVSKFQNLDDALDVIKKDMTLERYKVASKWESFQLLFHLDGVKMTEHDSMVSGSTEHHAVLEMNSVTANLIKKLFGHKLSLEKLNG